MISPKKGKPVALKLILGQSSASTLDAFKNRPSPGGTKITPIYLAAAAMCVPAAVLPQVWDHGILGA
jgi:hypothetical protein